MVVAGKFREEYRIQTEAELIALNGTEVGKSVPKFPFQLYWPTGKLLGTTPMICGGMIWRDPIWMGKRSGTLNNVSALAKLTQYLAIRNYH